MFLCTVRWANNCGGWGWGVVEGLRYCINDNVQTQTEPPSSPSAVKQKHLYTNRSSGNCRLGSTYCIQSRTSLCMYETGQTNEFVINREKSLSHVAVVVKFLDDNKPKRHLKSRFALFQPSLILFNFI